MASLRRAKRASGPQRKKSSVAAFLGSRLAGVEQLIELMVSTRTITTEAVDTNCTTTSITGTTSHDWKPTASAACTTTPRVDNHLWEQGGEDRQALDGV
jgi:hypothetical protein